MSKLSQLFGELRLRNDIGPFFDIKRTNFSKIVNNQAIAHLTLSFAYSLRFRVEVILSVCTQFKKFWLYFFLIWRTQSSIVKITIITKFNDILLLIQKLSVAHQFECHFFKSFKKMGDLIIQLNAKKKYVYV